MKYVKWIFVVLLISSLYSFVDKDKLFSGRDVGDKAPDFSLTSVNGKQLKSLKELKGKYVLLNFWASYDAPSRIRNLRFYHSIERLFPEQVQMVSVSFDDYKSIFIETIKTDKINETICFIEQEGETSELYKKYGLQHGFNNFLLDEQGVIIAKNISVEEMADYIR